MAYWSNTAPSFLKKTSISSAQSLYPPLMPLSESICNPNTAAPSCSYAPLVSLKNCPSKPSTPKLSFIESLDKEIQSLLKRKLVYHIQHGTPSDSLHFHRESVLKEVSSWIQPFQKKFDEYDYSFRDQLITLFATTLKQNIKDIPIHENEYCKFLSQWIRLNSSDDIIFNREIYRILAVDGFRGFKPKDLKQYLMGILKPLRTEFEIHTRGVRAMYKYIDEMPTIKSLTGTDSACVIFLTLIQFYIGKLDKELLDDQVDFQVEHAKLWAEGFLHTQSEYYHDIKNVNQNTFKSLEEVYAEHITNANSLKNIGCELLKDLSIPILK